MKENQFSEEQILDNNDNSPLFDEFLQVLGDKVRLRGFDKYKGGLDTVHDLTGDFFSRAFASHLNRCFFFTFSEWFPFNFITSKNEENRFLILLRCSVACFFALFFFLSFIVFVLFCECFVVCYSFHFTGLYSVYTHWRSIEIMFHVSTLLPYEKHDPQKLQRKRHIGNDIVCVVFLEADNTPFSPACIKSHFLHTFILVRPLASPASQIKMTFDMQQVRVSARIKRKPTRYEVSVVTRDEVGAYKPYLWEQSVFEKGPMFR